MKSYDFSTINDKDFEALACDLIGRELIRRIERFKPGKDKGVDGRFFSINEQGEIILQAKHYLRTDINGLMKNLKLEAAKIARLQPKRYIIATALPLSRVNKQAIARLFTGYIHSESDIFGQEDLNDLLAKHKEVELRFCGLWMTSTAVLTRLLNSGIFERSDFQLEDIKRDSRLYVQTADLEQASTLLEHKHSVIITGAPGIGKTTLAKMLCLKYVSMGYEFISIQGNIHDADKVFGNPKQKMIFYFDDFLGRNLLEAVHAKDSDIINFIKRVSSEKLKRFILTSRTNIINQGKYLIDQFAINKIDKNEYEIRIENISVIEKAKILYSHLWNSGLSSDFLDEIHTSRRYIKIIRHKNFNPRIISYITDSERMKSIGSRNYWTYIENTLDNPSEIWGHCWKVQIDQKCRDLVSLVAFSGRSISEASLESAFYRLKERYTPKSPAENALDFGTAAKICTGSLLNRSIGSGSAMYDLFNPSIGDYIIGSSFSVRSYSMYMQCLLTRSSINYLKTLLKSGKITKHDAESLLAGALSCHSEEQSDDYKAIASDLLVSIARSNASLRIADTTLTSIDPSNLSDDGLDEFLTAVCSRVKSGNTPIDISSLTTALINCLNGASPSRDNFRSISLYISTIPPTNRSDLVSVVSELFTESWENEFKDYIIENNIADKYYSDDDYNTVADKISTELNAIIDEYAGDWLQHSFIERIADSCSPSDIISHNIDVSSNDGDPGSGRWPSSSVTGDATDAQIEDIFEK